MDGCGFDAPLKHACAMHAFLVPGEYRGSTHRTCRPPTGVTELGASDALQRQRDSILGSARSIQVSRRPTICESAVNWVPGVQQKFARRG